MSRVTAVLMTAPDAETAERVSRAVVEERLAACANVVPGMTSIYRWEGRLHQESEVLVILKTTVGTVDRLIDRVCALHPYDVPELLALPVDAGADQYVRWVASEVGGA